MTRAPETIVVVGAGPAGITAAHALLERGARVRILDAGDGPVYPTGFADAAPATDSDGPGGFSAYLSDRDSTGPDVSPKFATPTARRIGNDYARLNRLAANDFHLFGALAGGGLTTIWGGLAAPYDDDDLKAFPFDAADLRASYRTVGARMGISGARSDVFPAPPDGLELLPPLELHPTAGLIAARYRARTTAFHAAGIRLGAPLQAVLTEDRGRRRACDYRGTCLNGCANGAIYNAAFDIDALREFEGFSYSPGRGVDALARDGTGWRISTRGETIEAKTVVLAAGTLATTRLALAARTSGPRRVRLLHNPVFASGLLMPGRLSAPATERAFAMAQLALNVDLADAGADDAHALLYSTIGLPTSSLAAHMPFSTSTSVRAVAGLREALVPMTCFFSGAASDSHAELTDRGLSIVGGHSVELPRLVQAARKRIVRALRRIGVYGLPGSTTLAPPGADLHFVGTLPMGTATDGDCRVAGTDGLYVVDGSVFPELPARPCTYTIMAIADRAMRRLPLEP